MLKNLSFYVVTFSNFFNIFWGESIFFSTNEFLGKGTHPLRSLEYDFVFIFVRKRHGETVVS